MNSEIDVTKLPGYRPEWSYKEKPPTPPEEAKRTVPKIISPAMARKISAAYCCAACWSPLRTYWNIEGELAGQYTIECEYCGGDVPGFVTRTYISYRIAENEEEYAQAKQAMERAQIYLFGPKQEKTFHSEEDILKQLGY